MTKPAHVQSYRTPKLLCPLKTLKGTHSATTISVRDHMPILVSALKTSYGTSFPGCTVDKNVCQCRGHRFNPSSGKTPHALEQLSPCTTTPEPAHPRAANRGKAHTNQGRPSAAKNKYYIFKDCLY